VLARVIFARKYQLRPKRLQRWRCEWRACGRLAFPGHRRRGADLPAFDGALRVAEREIGQLTMDRIL
jgi:hypothetical protein